MLSRNRIAYIFDVTLLFDTNTFARFCAFLNIANVMRTFKDTHDMSEGNPLRNKACTADMCM